jgi:lipopolysaccharide export system protein LptC
VVLFQALPDFEANVELIAVNAMMDTPGTRGPAMHRAAAETNRAYALAIRHSARVRRLRKLIPTICVGLLLVLVLAPYLNPFRAVAGLGLGPVSLSGTKVTMENPKLSGFRKDNKPYEMVAKTAVQDVRKPNFVELNQMTARIMMETNSWANLDAVKGYFDNQKEQMQLREGVRLRTDSGYDVRLKSADIDFKAGTVLSREPVTVNSGGTTVDADTLDVTDNGKQITFTGNVRAVVDNSGVSLGPDGEKLEKPAKAEKAGGRKP